MLFLGPDGLAGDNAAEAVECAIPQIRDLFEVEDTTERNVGRHRQSSLVRRVEASCYAACVKVSEVLRMLQSDGWYMAAQRRSHRQFKHLNKSGRVTVPGKPSDDLAPGTFNSILKQAGLK